MFIRMNVYLKLTEVGKIKMPTANTMMLAKLNLDKKNAAIKRAENLNAEIVKLEKSANILLSYCGIPIEQIQVKAL